MRDLAAADAALLEAEEALAELRRRASAQIAAGARRNEELAVAAAREERLTAELASAELVQAETRRTAEEARREVSELEAGLARPSAEHAAASQRAEAAKPQADEARQHASELAERAGALKAELEGLRERAEHGGRLAARLASAGWTGLLDAIDAPEATWPAIEALIGGELEQALLWRGGNLVERMAEAKGAARLVAISAGPSDDDGRASALAAVNGRRTLAEWVGGTVLPQLFARTVVAEEVAALLDGWTRLPPGWWAVTPQGDLADGRGLVVLRGRAEAAGGASARQHARRRELNAALERLEAEHEAANARAAREHAAHAEAVREQETSRAARERAEGALRIRRGEMEDAESRLVRGEREIAALANQLDEAHRARAAREAAVEPATDAGLAEREADARAARAAREAAATARDRAREVLTTARAAADEADGSETGRRRERGLVEAREAQLAAAVPAQREALGKISADLAEATDALHAARAADASATAARAEADAKRDRLRAELLELEGGAIAATRLAEVERAAQAAAIEVSHHEQALAASGRERELALDSLPEAGGAGGPGASESPQAAAELRALSDEAIDDELRRVRRTLGQIGSVNPFAIEEHRELAGRLAELTSQDADLAGAIGSTEQLIGQLDEQITGRFNSAFAAIGERFEEFCQLLFAGGSASLQLNDGSDGEAPDGIEIVVRPPGKRLQRLAMLSGGERALTGVALLFAMLSVNPVPFCILDEVDAALDEANIGRFALALRKLSETIDFVVITHNRATIEVADTIYGVTMTDAAVSSVLSLRLADLPVGVGAQ